MKSLNLMGFDDFFMGLVALGLLSIVAYCERTLSSSLIDEIIRRVGLWVFMFVR